MPWNCLCSSKSRSRRPQISAPILNNHETNTVISNTQTVPSILSHHQNKDAKPFSLNYVTERILAIVLPPRSNQRDNENNELLRDDGTFDESMQDAYERELISKLEQQHGKNYKLFDLESCISAISLEKLCELCKHLDAWLKSGREKVVILQDRGDRQRLGSAIAAYLEYLNICGSGHVQNQSSDDAKTRHHLDMDIFSMKKLLEDVIGPLSVPSHRRYLRYFSGLLSGKIRINSFPLYLRFVTVESPPSWLQHEPIALQQAEWRSFIKIYEGLNCVFTSEVHVIPITTRQFIYEIGQLQLRGDVIIRCYQISMNDRSTHSPRTVHRELIFSVQFHTCAIKERDVTFFRNDLDYACDDPRVPSDHKITLHFSDNKSNDNRHLHIQSPLIKIEPLNSITKYNSLERFDDDSLHTQGPLDGSLYATILKSPKSSLKSPRTPPAFISNIVNNNHRSNTNLDIYTSTPKPNRSSSTQNLISPPPEFSNKKIVEIKECYTTINPTDASSHKLNGDSLEANKVLPRSYSSTPTYEEIQIPSRSSSREPSFRYQTAPRSSSSLSTICKQPNIPQRSSSVSRIGNYAQSQSNHYRTIENCHYVNAVPNNSDRNQYQVRKEATKSPLTLSIDSGISSAAPANRRNQGSSVSPSIPKRTQERHEELDDILSDMLVTVQGISDIKTASNREVKRTPQTQHQIKQRPQLPQLHLQIPKKQSLYGNTNTVKRSQSYTSQDDSDCSTVSRSTVHTTGHILDRVCGDFYDTASTTTITPTPSESGRITPFLNTYTRYANDNILTQQAIEQRERELIMDLQNQSVDYSQSLRSVSSASAVSNDLKANNLCKGTEDDESIPYHAREDSRPFTYGDARGIQLSPTSQRKGTGMIKLQAGLSSPSLVRKHLGSNANNVNAQYVQISIKQHKSSGQTWLQLQQQKLRAKKELQRGDNQFYERNVTTENRIRPLRSRSSQSHRYDGYSSDTGAFNSKACFDEVDYRRPLHVQTPRSNERYHTITKTTTMSNESPLISMKRAHEQSKANNNIGEFDSCNLPMSLNSRGNFALTVPQIHGKYPDTDAECMNGMGNHIKASINEQANEIHYIALDELLASLSIENDTREWPLPQINGTMHRNQTNGMLSFDTNDEPCTGKRRNQHDCNEHLNEVLANLIEFAENESRPQHHNTNNSYTNGYPAKEANRHQTSFNHLINNFNNNHTSNCITNGVCNNRINRVYNYQEPTNNAIKRLTSESENSSSVSPSLSERSNGIVSWSDQVRDESFSSYRSETEAETSLAGSPRPETPAFPLTPRTPYGLNGNISPALPPKSPTSVRRINTINNNGSSWSLRGRSTAPTYDWSREMNSSVHADHLNQNDVSCYTSRRNSTTSTANSEPQEIAPHLVKSVRDSSKYWYKPTISREEAISVLRHASPGSFLVRDSTTFAKAFGLVMKVAQPPPGVQSKGTGDELVRHFLVEPTTHGVRLKGCSNEPVFTSLSALVYQHSIIPLALPSKLIIPDRDVQNVEYHSPAQHQLLTQGAACNVLYLFACDTESLTGPEAVRKAVSLLYSRKPLPKPTEVHFKVTQQGITLTDNTRQLFFRKHYPANNISFCGLDPDDRRWSVRVSGEVPVSNKSIYAFVARRSTSSHDNQCHVFCELEPNQPAAAITAFANKIVITSNGVQPYLRDI